MMRYKSQRDYVSAFEYIKDTTSIYATSGELLIVDTEELKFAVDAHKYLAKDDESTYEDSYHVKEFTSFVPDLFHRQCANKVIMYLLRMN